MFIPAFQKPLVTFSKIFRLFHQIPPESGLKLDFQSNCAVCSFFSRDSASKSEKFTGDFLWNGKISENVEGLTKQEFLSLSRLDHKSKAIPKTGHSKQKGLQNQTQAQ